MTRVFCLQVAADTKRYAANHFSNGAIRAADSLAIEAVQNAMHGHVHASSRLGRHRLYPSSNGSLSHERLPATLDVLERSASPLVERFVVAASRCPGLRLFQQCLENAVSRITTNSMLILAQNSSGRSFSARRAITGIRNVTAGLLLPRKLGNFDRVGDHFDGASQSEWYSGDLRQYIRDQAFEAVTTGSVQLEEGRSQERPPAMEPTW